MEENRQEYTDNRKEKLTGIYNKLSSYFDGDIEQTKKYYDMLQKVIRDGSLKVENETIAGLSVQSKVIFDKNDENATAIAELLEDQQSSYQKGFLTNQTSLKSWVGELLQLDVDYEKIKEDNKRIFEITDEKLGRVKTFITNENNTAKELEYEYDGLEDIIAKIREAKKKLAEVREGFANKGSHTDVLGNAVAWTKKDVDTAEKNLKEAKDAYEAATGKQFDAIEKNLLARQKFIYEQSQNRLQLQKQIDAEIKEQRLQAIQAEIDLETDGEEKREKQRALNREKERNQLEQESQQRIDNVIKIAEDQYNKLEAEKARVASENKDNSYEAKFFNVNDFFKDGQFIGDASAFGNIDIQGMMDNVIKQNDAARKQLLAKQRKEETAAQKDELAKQEDYWKQYLNIMLTYAEKEKEIRKQIATSDVTEEYGNMRIQSLRQDKDAELAQKGYDETITDRMTEDIQSLVNSLLYTTGDELISQLRTKVDELNDMLQDEDASAEELGRLRAEKEALEKKIDELIKQGKIDTQVDGNVIKQWQKYGNSIKNVAGQFRYLSEEISQSGDNAVSTVLDISDSLMEVADGIAELKAISDSGIEDIVELSDTGVDGMKKTAEAGAETMSAVEKASVILAIIAAAYQIISKIDSILNKREEKYKKEVEKQAEINALTLSVQEYQQAVIKARREENQWFANTGLDTLKNSWADAQDAIDNYYLTLHQKQKKYKNEWGGRADGTSVITDVLGLSSDKAEAKDNLWIEKQAGKKGFLGIGRKSQKTQNLNDWVRENFGEDLFNGDDLNVELAERVIELQGDKLQGETKATLEALVKQQKQVDEAIKQMENYVADMYSPLVDNMTDAIMNCLDTGEDALKSFEDMAGETFRNIAQEMVKDMVISEVLGDYQTNLMDSYKRFAKKEITKEELLKTTAEETDALKQRYESQREGLQEWATAIAETMDEIGINIKDTADKEQEATFGGFETMSEDTGTELSGRFSAMYIVQSEHLELAKNVAMTIASGVRILTDQNGTLEDIRSLQVATNNYLDDILRTTRLIYNGWDERIANIEKSIKDL